MRISAQVIYYRSASEPGETGKGLGQNKQGEEVSKDVILEIPTQGNLIPQGKSGVKVMFLSYHDSRKGSWIFMLCRLSVKT